jgi:hypothetical protein
MVYKPQKKWCFFYNNINAQIRNTKWSSLNHELLEFMTSLKNKTKFQNSISKTKIFVLDFFPYSKYAYKTMTSLISSLVIDKTIIISPNKPNSLKTLGLGPQLP